MDEFRTWFTDGDEGDLISEIYNGEVTPELMATSAALSLYKATARSLMGAVRSGFGSRNLNKALFRELRDNIYIFSGAKTFTQVKDVSSLLVEDGRIRPFTSFKNAAKERMSLYNEAYLKTEYETAIGQAQTAVKWQEIEKDAKTFPFLQRKAIMDANTSKECSVLNDIIAPVSDPIWRTRSPLTHFNCRCILTQIDKYADVALSTQAEKNKAMRDTDHVNPLFKGNPGIDKVVFNNKHPYFDIEPRYRSAARRNFDFPI